MGKARTAKWQVMLIGVANGAGMGRYKRDGADDVIVAAAVANGAQPVRYPNKTFESTKQTTVKQQLPPRRASSMPNTIDPRHHCRTVPLPTPLETWRTHTC